MAELATGQQAVGFEDYSDCCYANFSSCASQLLDVLGAGIAICLASGELLYLNPIGGIILDVNPETMTGRDIAEIFAPLPQLMAAAEADEPGISEQFVLTPGGRGVLIGFTMAETHWLPGGSGLQKVLLFQDISQHQKVREERDELRAKLGLRDQRQTQPSRPQRQTEPRPGEASIRVLVVDDSKLMQKALGKIYGRDPSIQVVGYADNGKQALELVAKLRPDVISLDLYMPEMDGVETLKRIMLSYPTPTVILTSANKGALDLTAKSILRFGAAGFITKPNKLDGSIDDQAEAILRQIRKVARLDLQSVNLFQPAISPAPRRAAPGPCNGLVAVSGGTGADRSYYQLLSQLDPDLPLAVVGVLPAPGTFLPSFISVLNTGSAFFIERAVDGAPLKGGICYLAGEDELLRLERTDREVVLRVQPETTEPGCDLLLADGARLFGHQSIALLLSGEGDPPAEGLAAIRAAGGVTLAQLPGSCCKPEYPQRAIDLDLVDEAMDLGQIGGTLQKLLGNARMAILEDMALFEFLNRSQLKVLAACLREQPMAPKEVLLIEGNQAKELLLVVSGEVEAEIETPLGRQKTALLKPGNLIGEISLNDGMTVCAGAVAISDGLLLAFDQARLIQLTEHDPALEAGLLRVFCRSLADKIRQANRAMTQIMAPGASAISAAAVTKGKLGGVDDATKGTLLEEYGLSDQDQQLLMAHCRAKRYNAGDFILTEGGISDTLYIIAEGEVRISRRIPDMGEETLTFLKRGEIFGEVAWIDRSPRSADAIAHTSNCTVMGISRQLLEAGGGDAESSVRLLRVLCRLLCRRIRRMNRQLAAWRTMAFYG